MDYIEALEASLGKIAKKKFLPLQPGDVLDTYAEVKDLVEEFGYKFLSLNLDLILLASFSYSLTLRFSFRKNLYSLTYGDILVTLDIQCRFTPFQQFLMRYQPIISVVKLFRD